MYQQLLYLKACLDKHPELKYEITQSFWGTDFLRFYQSQTNYNISKDNVSLSCNIYKEQRAYGFSLNQPERVDIDKALNEALAIIDKLPKDKDFVDVEDDLRVAEPKKLANSIEELGLELKTKILSYLAESIRPQGFELYGSFITNHQRYRLINSNGLDKEEENSPIFLEIKAFNKLNQVTVLESFGGEDFSYFDLEGMKKNLLNKIVEAKKPIIDVEPGEYEVILAPRCMAEFAQYLSYGMYASTLDRGASFFEGKVDKQVFPSILNITDDPTNPRMVRYNYGHTGHLYQSLKLIEDGYFRNFFCDNYYHHKTKLPKNGNSGACLVIGTGDKSLYQLISSVKRGLYISSLHYMNFINMKNTSLTGLTRDGTFLIDNGQISGVVNNLRFTERISRIMENIVALEDKSYTIPFSDNYEQFSISTNMAPHAKVAGFNISSSTKAI